MNEKLRQKLFEDILESAVHEYVNTTPTGLEEFMTGEEHVFSAAFERKMKQLIRSVGRWTWWRRHKGLARRLVAVSVVVLMAGSYSLMKVDAFRIPILTFFYEVGEKFSQIGAKPDDDAQTRKITDKFDEYLPTYVPDGFNLLKVLEYDDRCTLKYVNDDGREYALYFGKTIQHVAFDTENKDGSKTVDIDGTRVVIISKNKRIQAIMEKQGCKYTLVGDLSDYETVTILKSIKNF